MQVHMWNSVHICNSPSPNTLENLQTQHRKCKKWGQITTESKGNRETQQKSSKKENVSQTSNI